MYNKCVRLRKKTWVNVKNTLVRSPALNPYGKRHWLINGESCMMRELSRLQEI